MSIPSAPKPLTIRQERRLVEFLDERFLDITRNFKKRSEPSSNLRTLSAYLDATRRTLAFILQIPPIDPSTSLRIAYLLRLTGDVIGAIPGYRLRPVSQDGDVEPTEQREGEDPSVQETLQELLDFLDDLDQAWMTVLLGQLWTPDGAPSIPVSGKSSPPTQTDRARLRSLLFSGEAILEEWLTEQRAAIEFSNATTKTPNQPPPPPEDAQSQDDLSVMLSRMGLLDQFDSLFVKTIDHLGGFSENAVNTGEEVVMEAPSCG